MSTASNKEPTIIHLYQGAEQPILLLYTGAVMRDLVVEQHSTQNRLALNHPYGDYTALTPVINQENPQDNAQHA